MSRRLLVSTIAAALAACSPESKIDSLRITSSGTMPQAVLAVPYTFPVAVAGGTAPYTFSAAIPGQIGWLTVDPATGELSGVPDVQQASPIGFLVNVVDANQQTASATLAVKVVLCVENEVRACTATGTGGNAGQCMQSQYVCVGNAFPESCPVGTAVSTDITACGAACTPCVPAKADRCDGACSCGGGSACGDATTCCSGACVDTTSDEANCGACGTACTAAPAHGQPLCTPTGCSFTCDAGYTKCGDACVDLNSDGSNCGACDIVCTGNNPACVYDPNAGTGRCTASCPNGETNCNGACRLPSTFLNGDPLNCGGCGVQCPAPPPGATATCVNATCGTVCATGFGLCSGVCKDLQNDQFNCNGCGLSCGADGGGYDNYCSGGVCGWRCATGYKYCAALDECIPTAQVCRIVIDPICKLSDRGVIYCP